MTDQTDPFANNERFNSDQWPRILSHTWDTPDSLELHIIIDEDVHWFKGHFPDQPVLPGIAQTHWAAEFGCAAFAPEGTGITLENIKFSEVVLPGTECSLKIDFDRQTNRLSFKYSFADHLYSQGRIRFQ